MTRSRASAKRAGARAEQTAATWLAATMGDDHIERRVPNGRIDRGDVTGVRTVTGARVVVEVKDCVTLSLSEWITEAEVERRNDDAIAGVVVHKRRGRSDPGSWYVTMSCRDLAALLTGERPA